MSEFIAAFRQAADAVLANTGIRHEWNGNTLTISASSERGFAVRLVCETYGVYPYAGDWHGAPWDVTLWPPSKLNDSVQAFLRSVLSPDGELRTHTSNGRPYKWTLRYMFEGQWCKEEVGLFFFNWLGKRGVEVRRNEWLPPNKALQGDGPRPAGSARA